jgi:hypothetical protein
MTNVFQAKTRVGFGVNEDRWTRRMALSRLGLVTVAPAVFAIFRV